MWAIIEHAKPLTVKLLNNLLADNHIEVLNFDAEYVSLNHLYIPRLIIKIEDSHIAVQEFNLELRDSIEMLKNQQFNADDIVSIKTKSVYVDLGESFFIRQSEQTEDSPATLQLNLAKLPTINLGNITIRLPVLETAQANQHSLTMDNLILSETGKLNTVWRFDDFPLFSVDATLGKRAWKFDTLVDLGASYQGLESLQQYLNLLHDKQFKANPNSNNLLSGLQKQLTHILNPITEQQLSVQGQWTTHTQLNLLNGELKSQQSIRDLSLHSARWPSVFFTPQQPINFTLDIGQYPINDPFKALQPIETLALKLVFAPINYQLTPSDADINQLVDLLITDAEIQQHITQLIQQFAPSSEQPQIAINMTEPVEVIIPIQHDTAVTQVSLPNVTFSLKGLRLQTLLSLNHIKANSQQQWRSDVNWGTQFLAAGTTSTPPQSIDIKTIFPDIDIQHLTFNTASIMLNGSIGSQHASDINVALHPSSTMTFTDLNLAHQDGDKTTHKIQKNTAVQLASLTFNLSETSTINKSQKLDIQLAPFKVTAKQFIGQHIVSQKSIKTITSYATVDQASIDVQQAVSFSLSDDENIEQAIARWLQTPTANHVVWSIKQLDAVKQVGKSRRQPLLALNNVKLQQQLNLSKGLLVGSEQWQLDTLALSSYHLLKFADAKSPLSLAGQWTFDTDIEQALSTLKKVQPLPDNFNLQGHSHLVAGFALSELDNSSQFEMKIQHQLSSLSGRLADKSFIGGDVFAQCQFNWQQQHDKPNTPLAEQHFAQSQLVCPQTAISLQKANVGLLMTNLNVNANIELTKDGNKVPENWLQQITGLSETNVSLTASGDMLDGRFLLPEFILKLHDKSHGYLLLQGLSLATFLEEQPQVGVKASGLFDGVLPAELVDGKVTIAGGKLAARKPGGLIEVAGNPAMDQLALSQPYLELVFTALEHLNYTELSSTFDMNPNGDAFIHVGVKGKSRDIERPVHLNYDHQENLFQLYKSTQIGNQLQNKIETKVQY
ncbi:C4-dicarboxylate ABC transporter [Shewanella litoralis]|uniref:C4-dicarboxylate ABC transporter n=1 Tax=Shewanella litoralis TaxID=2282700 RepID=A0ABQ2R487_9GAMM|nr:YdbH domain-containing protein [Shewanella litoralis]GGQ13005.1 C4-dicarboxylate ABC transporter [Shewanella litoralis]